MEIIVFVKTSLEDIKTLEQKDLDDLNEVLRKQVARPLMEFVGDAHLTVNVFVEIGDLKDGKVERVGESGVSGTKGTTDSTSGS